MGVLGNNQYRGTVLSFSYEAPIGFLIVGIVVHTIIRISVNFGALSRERKPDALPSSLFAQLCRFKSFFADQSASNQKIASGRF
jgi:hypothetical protein